MTNSGQANSLLVVLIIIAIIVVVLPIVISIFINRLRKKQKGFVRSTSQRINALTSINEKYKGMFGCLKSCDINATNIFKYKRTFDHFCEDENKIAKFAFDYQDEILKSMVFVLKNASVNVLYHREIENISPTSLDELKMIYHLNHKKYIVLENKIFNNMRFNAPETFVFHVTAKYSSEKGYSNYKYSIDCSAEWLQEKFLALKKVDLVMTAHKMILNKITTSTQEKSQSTKIRIKPILLEDYHGNISYSGLLKMSYEKIVSYLLAKYGTVNGDYFVNESCKSKNKKISRSKEGLFIHHIDEDKAIMLSTDSYALQNPFRYQKADRLVYCNILEHLILHVKITEEQKNVYNNPMLVGIGGAVNFICRQINDCYSDYEFKQPMMITIRDMIKDEFDEYIMILQKLLEIIKKNPLYSSLIKKEQLALDFRGNIVKRVYNALI